MKLEKLLSDIIYYKEMSPGTDDWWFWKSVRACVVVMFACVNSYLDLAKANGHCSSTSEAFYYRVRNEVQEEACRRQMSEWMVDLIKNKSSSS